MVNVIEWLPADGDFVILNVLLQLTIFAVVALALAAYFKHSAVIRYSILYPALISLSILAAVSIAMQSTEKAVFTLAIATPPPDLVASAAPIVTFDGSPFVEIDFVNAPSNFEDMTSPSATNTNTELENTYWDLLFGLPFYVIALTIWVGGFLFFTIGLLRGLHSIENLVRESTALSDADGKTIQNILLECSAKDNQARFRISNQVYSPMLAGIVSPVILLPQNLISSLSDRQLKSVLLHELAHFDRKDTLANFLQRFVVALLWFHPLVHFMDKRISQAREEICDNYVLPHGKAREYGEALLQVSALSKTGANSNGNIEGRHLPLAVGIFGGEWMLERRIEDLLSDCRVKTVQLGEKTRVGLQLSVITSSLFLSACQLVPAADQHRNTQLVGVEDRASAIQDQLQADEKQQRLNDQAAELETARLDLQAREIDQALSKERELQDEAERLALIEFSRIEQQSRQREQEQRSERSQRLANELQQGLALRQDQPKLLEVQLYTAQAEAEKLARQDETERLNRRSEPQGNDAVYIKTQSQNLTQAQPQRKSASNARRPPTRTSGTLGPSVVRRLKKIQNLMHLEDKSVEPDYETIKENLDSLYEKRYRRGSSFEKATILSFFTSYYIVMENYADAIDTFEESLAINGLGEVARLRALKSLGTLHSMERNWQASLGYFRQWREMSAEEDDVVFKGLSSAHYHMENHEAAIPSWLSYMDLQLENGEELERGDYAYLHSLYFTIEDFEKADEVAREMILKFNDVEDTQSLPTLTSTEGSERLDEDLLPLTVVAPEYPVRAAQRGIEGWALVSFSVDSQGDVLAETVKVVDAEPVIIFNRSSIRAARRFKFEPRKVDGEGVTVPGVEYLFRYALSANGA